MSDALRKAGRRIAQAADSSRAATLLTGIVTAVGDHEVTVNVNGAAATVPALRSYEAYLGDTAQLLRSGNVMVALGSAVRQDLPRIGKVLYPAQAETCTIVAGGLQMTLPYNALWKPQPGQSVRIDWFEEGGVIAYPLSSAPVVPTTRIPELAAPPPPPLDAGERTFLATSNAGFDTVGRQVSVNQDVAQFGAMIRSGAWWYGTQVPAFLAGRKALAATVTMIVTEAQGPLTLWLHTQAARTGLPPALAVGPHRVDVQIGEQDIRLPDSWMEKLAAGPAGISTSATGAYVALRGITASTRSGGLTIEWSR